MNQVTESGSSSEQNTVNVICIKWGKKYGSDYVNTLHSMVSRHLSRPFRFVCFTDDFEGINDDIEVKAIPKIGFKDRLLAANTKVNNTNVRIKFATGPAIAINIFCHAGL